MHRTLAALAAALLLPAVASAQSYPGDAGNGTERGVEQLNNSGQVGTVTLYDHGATTLVTVSIKGSNNRTESVRLYRGPACDDIAPKTVQGLSDLKNGESRTTVKMPQSRLLSGNYNVLVFSSTAAGARSVACGHLY